MNLDPIAQICILSSPLVLAGDALIANLLTIQRVRIAITVSSISHT